MPDDIKLPPAAAWRYVPSKVWGSYVFTDDAARAADAKAQGCSPEALYTADQLRAAIEAAHGITEPKGGSES